MFNIIFPISTYFRDYAATQLIGIGENSPKGVAKQWTEFYGRLAYVTNTTVKTILEDDHQDISTPIISTHAIDDEIATKANIKNFLSIFPNAQTISILLHPSDYGHKAIVHMLMIKTTKQNL